MSTHAITFDTAFGFLTSSSSNLVVSRRGSNDFRHRVAWKKYSGFYVLKLIQKLGGKVQNCHVWHASANSSLRAESEF